jgi:signal transduction histidine kinase
LVIDDDEIIRANLEEILEAEGFDVISAKDGHSGLQLARQHLPALIICDVMMPELDGYGVLTELHREQVTATIPFIFLTARADRADLRQGMDLGADDYLIKPFTHDELLKAISTRLAKQAAVAQRHQTKMDDLRSSIALALPHELRTPLTGILGYSEILFEDCASLQLEEIKEIAKNINTSAERLRELILNFLLYAELEIAARDSYYAYALRGHSLCQIGPTAVEAATLQAQRTGREADLSVEMEDAIVQMSPTYVDKLIKELVHNAFKFSEARTPVRIGGLRNGQAYTVSVQDQGRGMTAEQIADVGAYLQFERARHEQQGQGLGLTIARRLAELHRGQLSIESVPGQQTVVRVVFPMPS